MRRCKVSLTQIDFFIQRGFGKQKAEIYSISNRNGG